MRKLFVGLLIALGCIGLVGAAVYAYYSNQVTMTINAQRALALIYTNVSSDTVNGNFTWTPTDIQANIFSGEWLAFDSNLSNLASHTFQNMNIQVEVINWGTLNDNDLNLTYDDGTPVMMTLCNSDAYHLYGYVPTAFDVTPGVKQFNVLTQMNESIGPGTYYFNTEVIKNTGRAC